MKRQSTSWSTTELADSTYVRARADNKRDVMFGFPAGWKIDWSWPTAALIQSMGIGKRDDGSAEIAPTVAMGVAVFRGTKNRLQTDAEIGPAGQRVPTSTTATTSPRGRGRGPLAPMVNWKKTISYLKNKENVFYILVDVSLPIQIHQNTWT